MRSMTLVSPALRSAAALLLAAAGAAAAPALDPGPAGPVIGQMTARILEQSHYAHHPLDQATSRELLKNYIEAFDYNHMIFDKADVDEFRARHGDSLAQSIKEGDISPAFEVFERFLKRLEEKEALARSLASSSFTFTSDESIALDRHEAPWPATAQESRELWRKRIKYELLQERLSKTKPEEQVKNVSVRYERLLRSYREYDASDVLQTFLSALARVYDPHSDYMAAPQMENFNISMRLSLVGIGAVLRSEDGYAKIVSLVPGGPADLDKRIKVNDRIEAVAQGDGPFIEAVGMKLDRLVQLIRGEKGTIVRLRVMPSDAIDPATRVVVSIVRDEIKLKDQEAKARVLSVPLSAERSAKIGVVDLPSFYADMKSVIEPKSTTRDVERLVGALKREGVDGLIIDLRKNGGGSLSETVALTGLFVPEGPVVQVKDHRGLIRVLADSDPGQAYQGPLLVLTSHASASASEILAAAIQDYARGVVVGEKSTFGKGTVQSIVELSQYLPPGLKTYKPGAVKLTIQKFYRISGGSTQNRGVVPDIQLPSIADHTDSSEAALKGALPYDEIDPARYLRLETVAPARLSELRKASAARVATHPEFAYLLEDIALFKKQKEEKAVSLNERKRLDEKLADEKRLEARKKGRLARHQKPLDSYEITLDSIDNPSLRKAAKEPEPAKAVAKSTAAAEGDAEYDKAPSAPDIVLEEAARIVADMAGPVSQDAQAGRGPATADIP